MVWVFCFVFLSHAGDGPRRMVSPWKVARVSPWHMAPRCTWADCLPALVAGQHWNRGHHTPSPTNPDDLPGTGAVPSHRLFPVEMADLPDGRDGTTQHWRCESSATWLQAWDSATRDGCWASAELPDLNVSNIWESPDEWHEDWAEAQGSWIEAKQHLHMRVSPRHPRPWPTTLVVSDGSVWHSGTEQATGTFGWVVRPRTGTCGQQPPVWA